MVATASLADSSAISGTWTLDEDGSDSLQAQIDTLKQEYREWSSEHGKINDPNKPDPFQSARKLGEKKWDSSRAGPVSRPSVVVRQMIGAESIKLYVSDRVIVAYDGKIRRRVNPNPNGRVHSATGKGTSKDSIGQTLTYLDGDAVVIETRTNSAERLGERFEVTPDDRLKITTSLYNPSWRRSIEFVRYYDRAN